LRMGVTFEDFQSEGNTPDFRERLKREVSEGEMAGAVLRSMVLEMPSGPEAVLSL